MRTFNNHTTPENPAPENSNPENSNPNNSNPENSTQDSDTGRKRPLSEEDKGERQKQMKISEEHGRIKCEVHQKPAILYCTKLECNKYVCCLCSKDHEMHHLVSIKLMAMSKMKLLNMNIDANLEDLESLKASLAAKQENIIKKGEDVIKWVEAMPKLCVLAAQATMSSVDAIKMAINEDTKTIEKRVELLKEIKEKVDANNLKGYCETFDRLAPMCLTDAIFIECCTERGTEISESDINAFCGRFFKERFALNKQLLDGLVNRRSLSIQCMGKSCVICLDFRPYEPPCCHGCGCCQTPYSSLDNGNPWDLAKKCHYSAVYCTSLHES